MVKCESRRWNRGQVKLEKVGVKPLQEFARVSNMKLAVKLVRWWSQLAVKLVVKLCSLRDLKMTSLECKVV